ncbi:MAG: HisA/HisF-related TIM barrel protein, partial [bacterium]|nr:HisA/HisF-related TIM barrel protein [bacterium]
SGAARVVVGTQAVKDPNFLAQLGKAFPGKVALGLDTKAGKIAIQGWTETVSQSLAEYIKDAPLEGVACLIFTDIARDGMLTGPNLESLQEALDLSPIPVIASGGIAGLEDLKSLKELKHPNLLGVISGKAIYEGRFSLPEALELLK